MVSYLDCGVCPVLQEQPDTISFTHVGGADQSRLQSQQDQWKYDTKEKTKNKNKNKMVSLSHFRKETKQSK